MFINGIVLGAGSEIGHNIVRNATRGNFSEVTLYLFHVLGSQEEQKEAPPETQSQSSSKTYYCQPENDKLVNVNPLCLR